MLKNEYSNWKIIILEIVNSLLVLKCFPESIFLQCLSFICMSVCVKQMEY